MFLDLIQGITVVETILSPSDLRSILGITLDLTPCLVWPVVTSMVSVLLTRRIPRPPQTWGAGDLPISSSNQPLFLVVSEAITLSVVHWSLHAPHWIGAKPFWSTFISDDTAWKSPSTCVTCTGSLSVSNQSSDAGVKSIRPM